MRIVYLLFILFTTQVVLAQGVLLKTANHYYNSMSYIKAIDAYEELLKRKGVSETEKVAILKNLADSYLKIKDSGNAERIYQTLVGSGGDLGDDKASILLSYAKALASNAKYKESQEQFDNYLLLSSNDTKAKGFSKLYDDIGVLAKNADCYKVDFLSINTSASDFSPTKFQNGLVFVSNRKNTSGIRRVFEWNNTPFLDLFYLDEESKISASEAGLGGASSKGNAKKSFKVPEVGSDEYTMPTANDSKTVGVYGGGNIGRGHGYATKPLTESDRLNKEINSKYHEGPAAFYKDGSRVIFTRNSSSKSSDKILKIKLYTAEAKKDGWANIKELPFNSNEYSTGHPSLSADEKLLFFASDMPGGYGGTDIYVSKLEGENWGAPINLGAKVNTSGNELYPFVDESGNLYFSSDGHPGLGELDIFFTQLEGGLNPKGRIINLGMPINSSKDDFGIITDGLRKSGYFSSNRKEGGNDDDIYKFERECELVEGCELLIAVYDADTKMPLANAQITYKNDKNEEQVIETNADGIVTLDNIIEGHDYSFVATKDEYTPNTVSYLTEECDEEPSRLEIPLAKPKKDTSELVTTISKNDVPSSLNPNAKTCIIKGKVAMLTGKGALEGVIVTLRNECDGTIITTTSDSNGNFEFSAVEGCDYTISGKKDDFGSKSTVQKFRCDDLTTPEIYMFKEGDVVEIENIYFDYGKHFIRKDAREGLDKLVDVMREYPFMKIELWSHTDSRSSKEFNQKLSDNRAKSTAEYLFKRGISRSRIVEYKGFGENQLVNGCADGVKCSAAEHQLNRRTEIKVVQLQ
jgi:outer membrane protein OmpA-like peptidoglycan-associated protein